MPQTKQHLLWKKSLFKSGFKGYLYCESEDFSGGKEGWRLKSDLKEKICVKKSADDFFCMTTTIS